MAGGASRSYVLSSSSVSSSSSSSEGERTTTFFATSVSATASSLQARPWTSTRSPACRSASLAFPLRGTSSRRSTETVTCLPASFCRPGCRPSPPGEGRAPAPAKSPTSTAARFGRHSASCRGPSSCPCDRSRRWWSCRVAAGRARLGGGRAVSPLPFSAGAATATETARPATKTARRSAFSFMSLVTALEPAPAPLPRGKRRGPPRGRPPADMSISGALFELRRSAGLFELAP